MGMLLIMTTITPLLGFPKWSTKSNKSPQVSLMQISEPATLTTRDNEIVTEVPSLLADANLNTKTPPNLAHSHTKSSGFRNPDLQQSGQSFLYHNHGLPTNQKDEQPSKIVKNAGNKKDSVASPKGSSTASNELRNSKQSEKRHNHTALSHEMDGIHTITNLQQQLKDTSLLSSASMGFEDTNSFTDFSFRNNVAIPSISSTKNPFYEDFQKGHDSSLNHSPNTSISTRQNSLLNPNININTSANSLNEMQHLNSRDYSYKTLNNSSENNNSMNNSSGINQSSQTGKKEILSRHSSPYTSQEMSYLFVHPAAFHFSPSTIQNETQGSNTSTFMPNAEYLHDTIDSRHESGHDANKLRKHDKTCDHSPSSNFEQRSDRNGPARSRNLSVKHQQHLSSLLAHNTLNGNHIPQNSQGHVVNLTPYEDRFSDYSQQSLPSSYNSLSIKQANHLHPFQQMFRLKQFTDITFIVGRSKKEFKCHSSIVSQSKYLRDQLLKHKQKIELPGMDEVTMEMLLDLIYGFDIDFSRFDRKAYQKLIISAKYYKLKHIECYLSKEYVSRFVNQKNVISMIRIAEEKKLKLLRKYAVEYLSQNFHQVKNNKKLHDKIDKDLLWEILHSILHSNSVNDTNMSNMSNTINSSTNIPSTNQDSVFASSKEIDYLTANESFHKYIETLLNLTWTLQSNSIVNRVLIRCNDSQSYSVDFCLLQFHFLYFRSKPNGSEIVVPLPHSIFECILQIVYRITDRGVIFLDDFSFPEYLLCSLLMLQWIEDSTRKICIRDSSRFCVHTFFEILIEQKVPPPPREGQIFRDLLQPILTPTLVLDLLWDCCLKQK